MDNKSNNDINEERRTPPKRKVIHEKERVEPRRPIIGGDVRNADTR